MRVGGQHHAPAALLPRKWPRTHRVESDGHQGPSGRDGKSRLQPGFDPRTVQTSRAAMSTTLPRPTGSIRQMVYNVHITKL